MVPVVGDDFLKHLDPLAELIEQGQ